jgi:putative SOS response-associated peptidase YedK
MCGRFAMTVPLSVLVREFGIEENACDVRPSYNIAPGRDIAAIIFDGKKTLTAFKWGLVPFWAKDPAMGSRMINARAETVSGKPAFRQAFRLRRCLIAASGFYEWKKEGREKRPVYIRHRTGGLFCLAGLYDFWQSGGGQRLATCAVITTEANSLIRPVHDRMPVIIRKEDHPLWLDLAGSESGLRSLLKAYPDDELEMYEVSRQVNSPANDSPECIQQEGYKKR